MYRTPRLSARLIPFAPLVAVGLLGGCSLPIPMVDPLHEETRLSNVPHVDESPIDVVTVNGSVSVTREEREDVEIVAHLKAVSAERLAAVKVVSTRSEDDTLSIAVEWPDGKPENREGCRFDVLIPDADGVKVRTSNGKVEIAGLGGKADLETRNGAIKVTSHTGPVEARTGNGAVTVRGSDGALDVSTRNGRIEVSGATAEAKLETSNGSIELALTAEDSGPIEAHARNGSVTVSLSRALKGELTLDTTNGSINIDSDLDPQVVSRKKTHAVLDLGESENSSSVTTSNGSIRVKVE